MLTHGCENKDVITPNWYSQKYIYQLKLATLIIILGYVKFVLAETASDFYIGVLYTMCSFTCIAHQ